MESNNQDTLKEVPQKINQQVKCGFTTIDCQLLRIFRQNHLLVTDGSIGLSITYFNIAGT